MTISQICELIQNTLTPASANAALQQELTKNWQLYFEDEPAPDTVIEDYVEETDDYLAQQSTVQLLVEEQVNALGLAELNLSKADKTNIKIRLLEHYFQIQLEIIDETDNPFDQPMSM